MASPPPNDGTARRGAPAATHVAATSGGCAERMRGPHAPRRSCVLATCGVVHHGQLLLPRLLHHSFLRTLSSVVEGRRQLHGHWRSRRRLPDDAPSRAAMNSMAIRK